MVSRQPAGGGVLAESAAESVPTTTGSTADRAGRDCRFGLWLSEKPDATGSLTIPNLTTLCKAVSRPPSA